MPEEGRPLPPARCRINKSIRKLRDAHVQKELEEEHAAEAATAAATAAGGDQQGPPPQQQQTAGGGSQLSAAT